MSGLLAPGSHRAAGSFDDAAVVGAMLQVEVAWVRTLAKLGAVDEDQAARVAEAAGDLTVDVAQMSAESEAAGNPVVPLVARLREAAGPEAAPVVHRGLTSQDVVDTALVLLARDGLARIGDDLAATATALAELAREHRDTVMVGRTLTQHAVPVTFGLKAAQWLAGVLDAAALVDDVLGRLPVQCGGAAGTLALTWPGLPWHTNRSTVTRIGAAVVSACDALGVIAGNVALLSRPEVAEVHEGPVAGRGGSSTMPHKRNPVLSVLVRSAALQAPLLGAELHLAAAQAVDERPDGAWHAEWPALQRLLELGVTAASQAAELTAGLEVHTDRMAQHVSASSDDLLSESGRSGDPADYLGVSGAFVDALCARVVGERARHG